MYKYQCKCGKQGVVEVADCDNKYPCWDCYDKEKENEDHGSDKARSPGNDR